MSRMLSLLAFSACVVVSSDPLFAQAPKAGRARVGPPAVDAALQTVLIDWFKNTRGINSLNGSHTKYVYDSVFKLETRGVGRFYYEAPDKGRIDIFPAEIKKGHKARWGEVASAIC